LVPQSTKESWARMKKGDIQEYWDEKAVCLKTDPAATMKDIILRALEIEAIGARLQPDDVLLDVGTGNAFGALKWARLCRDVVATDNSAKMIEAAREAVSSSGQTNIRIELTDVLDLHAYASQFSAVSCVRCLINLTSAADQERALDQLAGAITPGGRLFLIEGLAETFEAMNAARIEVGLDPIPLNWHNRLFIQTDLEGMLAKHFRIEERVDFGEYYFLSRVVHPLMVAPEQPAFDGALNKAASQIWRSGVARGTFARLSTLVLYVCRRF
jgi:ubiquinone/menaquinone biosynthesis C-methylase UbiE